MFDNGLRAFEQQNFGDKGAGRLDLLNINGEAGAAFKLAGEIQNPGDSAKALQGFPKADMLLKDIDPNKALEGPKKTQGFNGDSKPLNKAEHKTMPSGDSMKTVKSPDGSAYDYLSVGKDRIVSMRHKRPDGKYENRLVILGPDGKALEYDGDYEMDGRKFKGYGDYLVEKTANGYKIYRYNKKNVTMDREIVIENGRIKSAEKM